MEQDHAQQDIPLPGQPLKARGVTPTGIHDDINTATRGQHARLNRQILQCIPLALPPTASGPSTYGQGIAAFAQIYYAFEQVWDEIALAYRKGDDSHDGRVLAWLATLRPPGLVRSRRLEQDLQHVSRCTGTDLDTSRRACEHTFRRMRISIRKRPHTLVAYAWVMYMALFSGGRVIRQMLSRAGPGFWQTDGPQKSSVEASGRPRPGPPPETPGFSFLFFDDGEDGTLIKNEFKSRLTDAETLLSDQEKQDIVIASIGLFDDCIAIVGSLDRQMRPEEARRKWMRRYIIHVLLLSGVAGMIWISMYLGWAEHTVSFGHNNVQRQMVDGIRRCWAGLTGRG